MSLLSDFLLEHPVEGLRREVIISSRLKDYPFEIQSVSAGEIQEYSRLSRRWEQGKSVFDGEKFNLLLILNHCSNPDFRSVEMLEKTSCATPEALVNYTLKAGEIGALAKAIYELSGFGESLGALKAQVKN